MQVEEPPSLPGRPSRNLARLGAGIALGALSGVIATASFEPYHLPLIWVAFVPMIVAQHRVLPRRLSGLAIGIGIGLMFQGYLGPGLSDAKDSLAWYLEIYGVWVGLLVWAVAARSRSFHERTGYRWLVLTAPVAWVALDFIRSTATEVAAGTWGYPAYALYSETTFLQPVSVFGIHGLNLLILVTNWAIARSVIAMIDARTTGIARIPALSTRRAVRGLAAVAAAILAWGLLGVVLIRPTKPTVRVATVQPGPVGSPEEALRNDFAQSRDAGRRGAKLIVWHEGGLKFDPRIEHTAELRALAAETGAYLAIGWSVDNARGRLNEATVLSPDGRFLGSYGKDHPGTFAGDYSDHQGEYPRYDTSFGRLATIICFDLDFTDTAREWARRGARLIAVPSNDVKGIAETHYTHLVFRAIESRLPMAKADSKWDSAIIDPYGRIIEKRVTPDGGRATLVADLPLGSGRSPAVALGDWVGWLAVAATAAFAAISLFTRIQNRRRKAI